MLQTPGGDDFIEPTPSLNLDKVPVETLFPVKEGADFDSSLGFVSNVKAIFDLKEDIELDWSGSKF